MWGEMGHDGMTGLGKEGRAYQHSDEDESEPESEEEFELSEKEQRLLHEAYDTFAATGERSEDIQEWSWRIGEARSEEKHVIFLSLSKDHVCSWFWRRHANTTQWPAEVGRKASCT